MFIASEVGKRVEKIWHDEADNAQSKYATLYLINESNDTNVALGHV